MDTTSLRTLVGDRHAEEISALLDENGSLPGNITLKNPKVTLILAIVLGIFAIDRLYQGGIKLWFCKMAMLLLTIGMWVFVDIGYSIKSTQETNYERIMKAAQAV